MSEHNWLYVPRTAIVGTVVALLLTCLLQLYRYMSSSVKFDAPMLYNERGSQKPESFYRKAHEDFQNWKGKFFRIGEHHGDTIVVPFQYLNDLSSSPEEVLSSSDELDEYYLQRYNFLSLRAMGGEHHAFVKSIKVDLTKHLGSIMEILHEEIQYSFKKEIPNCEDWTEVSINYIIIRIVAILSGRVFVGAPLCHDPIYLNCAIEHTLNVFMSIPKLRRLPPALRWISKYYDRETRTVYRSVDTMKTLIKPLFDQALKDIDNAPANIITWNMKNSSEKPRGDLLVQTMMQLGDAIAAIHTTSATATHVIFDLAANRDFIGPIKEEIAAVRAAEKVPHMTQASIVELKKLDSVIRESQRHNIILPLNMRRKLRKDVVLHDSTILPRGSHIAFPAIQVSGNSDLWDKPEVFDGLRFYHMRQQPGQEMKHQFVSIGERNMDFGFGRNACPGRYFASNEIKLILIHFLENFDFKFKDGQTRPPNIYTPGGYIPNGDVTIMIRRRREQ